MKAKDKLEHISNILGMWGIIGVAMAVNQETIAGGIMALIAITVSSFIKPMDD